MTVHVERQIALPLYHQIAQILRSRIIGGEWSSGDRIPSETTLAKTFSVSTVTLRQALEALKSEGLLEGRQGSGTFVRLGERHKDHVAMSVPLDTVALPMAEYEVKFVDRELQRAPMPEQKLLNLGPDGTCVRVRRLRLGPQGPLNLSTSYIPEVLGNSLTDEDLQRPLLMEALEERGGHFTGAFQTIESSLAGPEEARLLDVPLGSALLLVRRSYELADGTVAYVVVNRHPSGRFVYEARLTREPDVSAPTDSDSRFEPRWALGPAK